MKAFGPPRGSEQERRILINKLKTIKDSREREKILWALEGLKKEHHGGAGPATEPAKPSSQTARAKFDYAAGLPANFGKLTRYAPPFLVIFFGLVLLLQALIVAGTTGNIQGSIGNLIMGTIFIIFGFVALRRVKKMEQAPQEPSEAAKKSWP